MLGATFRAWFPAAASAAIAATVALGALARAGGDHLGAPLAPFFATLRPRAGALALPVAALLGGGALVAPRLRARSLSPPAFAALAFALALTLRLALAAATGGAHSWWSVFAGDSEAQREYLPALPALSVGLHAFLDRFAEVAPSLPTHPSGHPPGLLVALHLLRIDTARGLAAFAIGTGALAAPLTYALGRSLLSEESARTAALLFVFAPSSLLYGATSADALYATLGVAAAAALLARRRLLGVLGPPALAVASFFSAALLGAGLWAVLVLGSRGQLRRAATTAAAVALCVAGLYAALYAATGFDPVGTLHSLDAAYRIGIAGARPYAFWVVGSPAAFLVALGLPVAWLALRAIAARDAAATALAAVVVASALLGFTKAETERIWLFLVPFACIAAARVLDRRRLGPVLLALAAQALAVQLLLFTIW